MPPPTPQAKFEVAVHEGYQFTEQRFTRVKLLISIADAAHQWVGWYAFAEGLVPAAAAAYDNIMMYGGRTAADKVIQFGDGTIDRSAIQLKHPRAVDRFHATGIKQTPTTTARIHDARFVDFKQLNGAGSGQVKRLEMSLGIDLITGGDLEILQATVSMLSPARPHGAIRPALGMLMLLHRESFASAQAGPSQSISAAVQVPG